MISHESCNGGYLISNRWVYLVIPAIVVVVVGLAVSALFQGDAAEGVALPAHIRSAPSPVREAYTYAVEHPEVLQYMPCYCGCGMSAGHTSNLDCFIKERRPDGTIVFDDHGYG